MWRKILYYGTVALIMLYCILFSFNMIHYGEYTALSLDDGELYVCDSNRYIYKLYDDKLVEISRLKTPIPDGCEMLVKENIIYIVTHTEQLFCAFDIQGNPMNHLTEIPPNVNANKEDGKNYSITTNYATSSVIYQDTQQNVISKIPTTGLYHLLRSILFGTIFVCLIIIVITHYLRVGDEL